jgi:hypothetical protein
MRRDAASTLGDNDLVAKQLPEVPKEARFATWHTPPSPDPVLLRRLKRLRYERFLAILGGITLFFGIFTWIEITHARFGGFTACLAGIFTSFILWVWSRRARTDTSHLFDIPATVPQFPIDLRMTVSGLSIGSDSGAISFIGDHLHFEGLRTSFDVTRWDVSVLLNGSDRLNQRTARRSRTVLSISYLVGGERFTITLSPYDQVPGLGNGLLARFRIAVQDWALTNERSGSIRVVDTGSEAKPDHAEPDVRSPEFDCRADWKERAALVSAARGRGD